MEKIRLILKYLRYYFSGKTKYDIHSPFVFNLIVNVFNDTKTYKEYRSINSLRLELLKSNNEIRITDFGAGSTINTSRVRKISDVAKNSAKSGKYGELLFRLVNHLKPQNILELGTSLGISTLYQALPLKSTKIITMEGCPQTAAVARQNFEEFKLKNVQLVIGNFDEKLDEVLSENSSLDFIFFDGNHRKKPTINYFEKCLTKSHSNTVMIFDDIHWSDEMEEAWGYIKSHPKVKLTLDLFFIGIVFFREEQQTKEHFVIRY